MAPNSGSNSLVAEIRCGDIICEVGGWKFVEDSIESFEIEWENLKKEGGQISVLRFDPNSGYTYLNFLVESEFDGEYEMYSHTAEEKSKIVAVINSNMK